MASGRVPNTTITFFGFFKFLLPPIGGYRLIGRANFDARCRGQILRIVVIAFHLRHVELTLNLLLLPYLKQADPDRNEYKLHEVSPH